LTSDIDWPTSAICNDMSIDARTNALKEGPYGRCVYFCDNNVVDHQVVNFEFANQVTAAFTMCAYTQECSRTIKLMGTLGEIRGNIEKNEIEINYFLTGTKEVISLNTSLGGHSGGDSEIMRNFIEIVQGDNSAKGLTSADISVQSHVMAFAAEKSRLESSVIYINKYLEELIV
jgi:hypothetical protein